MRVNTYNYVLYVHTPHVAPHSRVTSRTLCSSSSKRPNRNGGEDNESSEGGGVTTRECTYHKVVVVLVYGRYVKKNNYIMLNCNEHVLNIFTLDVVSYVNCMNITSV